MMTTIRDVTLRDGLQNQPVVLSTEEKVRLYELLMKAGVKEAQVTSFVSPKRIPQLADAEALWRALAGCPGQRDALIANYRGYQRAKAVGARRLEMVLAVSPSYHRQNSNRSQEETFAEVTRVASEARQDGVYLAIALANGWHCTYEGDTSWEQLRGWLDRAAKLQAPEVAVADTTGYALPEAVEQRVRAVKEFLPDTFVRVHLHALSSRGDGAAKAQAALDGGADGLDAGLLGLGGSPFAGEVGGNIDLLKLVDAGIIEADREPLRQAEAFLSSLLLNRQRRGDE